MNSRGTPENLKPFRKGQSGNPNGRPKSLTSRLQTKLKDQGVNPLSKMQIIESFKVLMNCPVKTVQNLARDEEQPIFVRLTARELLHEKRGWQACLQVMERAIGKTTDFVEVSSDSEKGSFDLSELSSAEAMTFYRLYKKAQKDTISQQAIEAHRN